MKKIALATVFVLSQALALSAFAQDKTRAEVKAEAASAVKSGAVVKGEGTPNAPAAKSTKARADVKAEAKATEKAGAVVKGEGSASPSGKSTKARAEVKSEAASAVKAGTMDRGEATKK